MPRCSLGIDWCVEQKVDVISMSLGGLVMDAETPPTYTEAILTCLEAGIPVVAAIGNEGEQTTGSPGNDLFALSVGATDPHDRVAGFSGGRTHILRRKRFHRPPVSAPPLLQAGDQRPGSCHLLFRAWGEMEGIQWDIDGQSARCRWDCPLHERE